MGTLTKSINHTQQTAAAEEKNAGCLMYNFNEEHLPSLQEALRRFLLEDPNVRGEHQKGLRQFESIKRRVFGEGRLLRPGDPPETIDKLLPQRPDAAGVEVPAILASELALRIVLWEYFKARLSKSRFESGRQEKKLEKFRQAILALRGDLDPRYERPGLPAKAMPKSGRGSFGQSLAGAIRRAAAKHKSDRLITCQLKRHAFRKIAKILSRQELEHLRSSLAELEWGSGPASQEVYLKSYNGSARWRRQLSRFYEGLPPVKPVSVESDQQEETSPAGRRSCESKPQPEQLNLAEEDPRQAAERREHPDMRLVSIDETLLERFRKQLTPLPELLLRDRKLIPLPALEDSEGRAPDVKTSPMASLPFRAEAQPASAGPDAESLTQPRSSPPAAPARQMKAPDIVQSWVTTDRKFAPLRLNSHLSVHAAGGRMFLRFEGKLKPGDGCRVEDRNSVLEFELPERFRDRAAMQDLKQELQADFKEHYQNLLGDPFGNGFTGGLVARGFRLRRAENCICRAQIFAASLADDALLKDIMLEKHAVLCLRGKELKLSNVKAFGAVLDVSLEKMSCKRVFFDGGSCLRGDFGEAFFDEYSELHGYAAEANLSRAYFAAPQPSSALKGLVVLKEAMPQVVFENLGPEPLDFFKYEAIRENLDKLLGALGLFNLLTGEPLCLGGHTFLSEPDAGPGRVKGSNRIKEKNCYGVTIPSDGRQSELKVCLLPFEHQKKCWLIDGVNVRNSSSQRMDYWSDKSSSRLEPVHFHDVLFMLLDLFYREGGERWYARKRCYFGVENADGPRLYVLGGGAER